MAKQYSFVCEIEHAGVVEAAVEKFSESRNESCYLASTWTPPPLVPNVIRISVAFP